MSSKVWVEFLCQCYTYSRKIKVYIDAFFFYVKPIDLVAIFFA